MPFFEQIALWVTHHRTSLIFGLIWTFATAIAAIYVRPAVRQGAAPTSQEAQRSLTNLIVKRRGVGAPQFVAALISLALFLTCYIAMTLVWEDFAYYDDSAFTLVTLKGHNLPPEISPEDGRFLPLAFQEFNLVRHFTDTITGYHILTIVQLLTFCWILLILDDQLVFTIRVILLIIALLTPSILMSFYDLLMAERDVLFFLAFFALFVKRFEQTRSTGWAVAAVVCAQIMIYTKETVFVLLLGFAASRLILRCRNMTLLAGKYDQDRGRQKRLDLCIIFLALLFVILYLGFVGNTDLHYAASARLPRADIVLGYTRIDLLPWLLLATVLGRSYLILRRQVAPSLLWDGLAIGGVAYFLVHLYLSIFGVYYLAPIDVIAVLYIGRIIVLSWQKIRPWGRMAATLLTFLVLFQDLAVSGYVLFERKNVIHAKTEIASIIKKQYRSSTGNSFRLFFPFAEPYVLMEFAAYLSHVGVPVEGTSEEVSSTTDVVLAESNRSRAGYALPGDAEDGPCRKWKKIMCHVIGEPIPGDLVVLLPDDVASLAEASAFRTRGQLLFIYEPRPCIPGWLHWIFDNLHVAAQGRYRYDALPDRWMNASVIKWK